MDIEYVLKIEARLLEHRYRYYVLDHPVLSDFEYDYLERYYLNLCNQFNHSSILDQFGVGWNENLEQAMIAKQRVDSNTDYHSLWEQSMQPVWDKLGRPKYLRKSG